MSHDPKGTLKGNVFTPSQDCPDVGHECCEQTVEFKGYIHSPYRWTQRTRTMRINVPPQADTAMATLIGNTAQAWEAAGYRIHGHSITDTGGGWEFFLTVGWDECVPCHPGPQAK